MTDGRTDPPEPRADGGARTGRDALAAGAHGGTGRARQPVRVLLTGWFSFLHGEATAGDVLAAEAVSDALRRDAIPFDTAWSPGFRPGGLDLRDADPDRYSHLVFCCGPLHSRPPGPGVPAPLAELHRRFRRCRRIAVGVSVTDPADPAVAGFHRLLPRDGPDVRPLPDLALSAPAPDPAPVVGVVLARGQHEYGALRRHGEVESVLGGWLSGLDAARVEIETRLDAEDWRLAATPGQLRALLARMDVVVTTRLHGLVLALEVGVPALAVDPVVGAAKVTAQAEALDWPAVLPADGLDGRRLDRMWAWCRSAEARSRAAALREGAAGDHALVRALTAELRDGGGRPPPAFP